MHRTDSYETALVSEMPIKIEKENVIIAPGQGEAQVSILHDDTCEELVFPYHFQKGKIECSSRYTSKHTSIP